MARTGTSLFLFTSTVLFLTIFFYFSPLSHNSSPILAKVLSFFHRRDDNTIFSTSSDQDLDLVNVFNHQEQSTWPEIDEKDVVVLTEKNFSDFIARNQHVMVVFQALWCFWSQRLAPEYAAAATLLKGQVVLAKVDATAEQKLARKYRINGYPSMYLFVNGTKRVAYYHERTREAIATWVKQKMGLAVQNVTTTEEAKHIISNYDVVVLGFLDTLEGPASKELAAAAKLHVDVDFYQTTNVDVVRSFDTDSEIQHPALVMLKLEAGIRTRYNFDGPFTRSTISNFVSKYKHPSVITLTKQDASHIYKNPMKQLWLFAPMFSSLLSTFREVAYAFQGQLLFVHVETGDEDFGTKLANEFGINGNIPGVVAYNPNGDTKKNIYHGELTLDGIKSFAEEFLENKLLSQADLISDMVLKLPSESYTSYPTSIPYAY